MSKTKTKVWVTAQVSRCIGEVDAGTYVEYLDKAEALWKEQGHPTIRDIPIHKIGELKILPTEIDKMDGWVWESLKIRKQREKNGDTEKGS